MTKYLSIANVGSILALAGAILSLSLNAYLEIHVGQLIYAITGILSILACVAYLALKWWQKLSDISSITNYFVSNSPPCLESRMVNSSRVPKHRWHRPLVSSNGYTGHTEQRTYCCWRFVSIFANYAYRHWGDLTDNWTELQNSYYAFCFPFTGSLRFVIHLPHRPVAIQFQNWFAGCLLCPCDIILIRDEVVSHPIGASKGTVYRLNCDPRQFFTEQRFNKVYDCSLVNGFIR
jgi:hypothetical protein